jgi:hypothetical protein
VRLRHGAADVPALEREINRMGGGKFVNDYPLGPQAANTERSIHLQAVALWLLAGCSRCWGCSSSGNCTHG